MPDNLFVNPRLASIYDHLEGERDDLDHYRAIAKELKATSVLDIGCGTGVLACLLAADGIDVTGVDPANASLDVARQKPGAERVRWILGDASALPPLTVDLAVMTGNVAQVFTCDDDWRATLNGSRRALRESGHLVFETRDPGKRAWERWNREDTFRQLQIAGVGTVETWHEVVYIEWPLVSFRTVFRFSDDGVSNQVDVLISKSTLRFRSAEEIRSTLNETGFDVIEVRDAPDRPGMEFVFVATAT